ncbi:hypothetical protein [Roseofilum casamattae]|uniref:DUF5615 domain-containing protein n=1 Tax=Roseofilum casamattae BLCC-M143 TaxID=3022442 RepID=A0ABT7C0I7_9CYAN|nr:hypothetical protein [Roseofilum casamattae]MDJ1184968.1 hypothetical protein [Roseofilum casamattae BLCC-M143]
MNIQYLLDENLDPLYREQYKANIGQILDDLILIALAGDPNDYQNRIIHIPL